MRVNQWRAEAAVPPGGSVEARGQRDTSAAVRNRFQRLRSPIRRQFRPSVAAPHYLHYNHTTEECVAAQHSCSLLLQILFSRTEPFRLWF